MRLALSLIALAFVLAGAGALAAWGMQRVPGETAAYRVEAIGPGGALLDEVVQVENGTALRALEAAAQARGLALSLAVYPGMGTYVRAIGGYEASGSTGWVYEVHRDGSWESGDRSAELYPLQKGDSVRWSWTQP